MLDNPEVAPRYYILSIQCASSTDSTAVLEHDVTTTMLNTSL